MRQYYDFVKSNIERFGSGRAFLAATYKLIRKVVFFEILYILLHDRDKLKNPERKVDEELSFKIATKEDLIGLMDKKELEINNDKIELYNQGDICLLNYSNKEIAGYTHVHIKGRPTLMPYLKLEIPDNMLYNFAGLTAPKFRGRNHHSIRHYEVMQLPQCLNKKYMLSYVAFDNFAAIRGGKKGGRFIIGYIMIFGIGSRKFIKLSKGVKNYNIRLSKES